MGKTYNRSSRKKKMENATFKKYCVFTIRMGLRRKSTRRGEKAEGAIPLQKMGQNDDFSRGVETRCTKYIVKTKTKSTSGKIKNNKKRTIF